MSKQNSFLSSLERQMIEQPTVLDDRQRRNLNYRLKAKIAQIAPVLQEIRLLLEKSPPERLQEEGAAILKELLPLSELVIKKMDLPQVRRKGIPVVGKPIELEAVKSFDLGPFNKQYYLRDEGEKQEINTFGYSFTRGLTLEEQYLINDISFHIEDLRRLLVPHRVTLKDCTLEDFLNNVVPPLIEDAQKKGVLHQITIDYLDNFASLDTMAAMACQDKTERGETE